MAQRNGLPPLSAQRSMSDVPAPMAKWLIGRRDVLAQELALTEDLLGLPYSQSLLYKRRVKARQVQE